jgi:hypothetical protein
MKQGLQSSKMGWAVAIAMALAMVSVAGAQDDQHGRKWKPLPPTAHIVVTVVKGFNGKPLPNAAVIFHAVRDGRDDGNLEVKTDPDGNATIDIIEVGSQVNVQVIADGFATTAQDLNVDGPTKTLEVKLLRPREQVSTYVDNDGKAAQVKPGVQEPPHSPGSGTPADPTNPTAVPAKVPPVPTNPTQLPGPLNAPPGTVTIPTQPGAPVPTIPPVAPPPAGTPPPGTPQ